MSDEGSLTPYKKYWCKLGKKFFLYQKDLKIAWATLDFISGTPMPSFTFLSDVIVGELIKKKFFLNTSGVIGPNLFWRSLHVYS